MTGARRTAASSCSYGHRGCGRYRLRPVRGKRCAGRRRDAGFRSKERRASPPSSDRVPSTSAAFGGTLRRISPAGGPSPSFRRSCSLPGCSAWQDGVSGAAGAYDLTEGAWRFSWKIWMSLSWVLVVSVSIRRALGLPRSAG